MRVFVAEAYSIWTTVWIVIGLLAVIVFGIPVVVIAMYVKSHHDNERQFTDFINRQHTVISRLEDLKKQIKTPPFHHEKEELDDDVKEILSSVAKCIDDLCVTSADLKSQR